MAYMRLGDLLISTGAISREQLEQALELQKGTKQRLGDVLIQNGFITEKRLIDALKIQLGIEFIDLTKVSLPIELAKFVPKNIARRFCVVPVAAAADTLYLAMSDPLDFMAQEEVKAASRKRVIPMIATRKAVEQAIGRLYSNEGTAKIVEEMKREVGVDIDAAPGPPRGSSRRATPPPPSSLSTPSSSGPLTSGPATSIWSRRQRKWWCGCAWTVCCTRCSPFPPI